MIEWAAIRAFFKAIPAQVWIALAVLGALAAMYHHAWNAGYAAADAKWQAIVRQEREDQEKAIREAGEESFRVIDHLISELEERNALIDQLNAEGDTDPDAASGGISADSVRRINRSRKARSQ